MAEYVNIKTSSVDKNVPTKETFEQVIPTFYTIVLKAADWDSSGFQTVAVDGVLADEMAQKIVVVPKTTSIEAYKNAQVCCTEQAEGSLTFCCNVDSKPNEDLNVYVVIKAAKKAEKKEKAKTYFTFSSPSAFTVAVSNNNKNWDGIIEYSHDLYNWFIWDGTSALDCNDTNELYLRGTNNTKIVGNIATPTTGSSSSANNKFAWKLTGTDISCIGNIEILLDWQTVEAGNHPTMAACCFHYMFYNCKSLITAPELPATDITTNCYSNMFYNCTSLTTAPTLPATTLANYCYSYMFRACTSLVNAPKLPATNLADGCYYGMFTSCTKITAAPALSTTTLKPHCYEGMFASSGISQIPALPATVFAESCYANMFSYCKNIVKITSFGGMVKASNFATTCFTQMFAGCTNLLCLPLLHCTETTTNINSMTAMFSGCTSIKISNTRATGYTATFMIQTNSGLKSTVIPNMFANTGGTFKASPAVNTIYYAASTNTVVNA